METINRNRTNKVLWLDLEISAAGGLGSPTISNGLWRRGGGKQRAGCFQKLRILAKLV